MLEQWEVLVWIYNIPGRLLIYSNDESLKFCGYSKSSLQAYNFPGLSDEREFSVYKFYAQQSRD